MRILVIACFVAAALVMPSRSSAQSAQQKAELATKLLAAVLKEAQPGKSTYAIIGTATAGNQTKVYIQQEINVQDKKAHLNFEYTCAFLDDGAGWMCAPPSLPLGLIFVR
jgi:hypothetical protein